MNGQRAWNCAASAPLPYGSLVRDLLAFLSIELIESQCNAITLSVTLGIVAFILLTLAAIVAVPVALAYIPLPGVTALVVKIGRWPILFALVTLGLAVLYRYGPSRTEPRLRWITWGSVSAAVVWLAASVLFSWYVASSVATTRTMAPPA